MTSQWERPAMTMLTIGTADANNNSAGCTTDGANSSYGTNVASL